MLAIIIIHYYYAMYVTIKKRIGLYLLAYKDDLESLLQAVDACKSHTSVCVHTPVCGCVCTHASAHERSAGIRTKL